MSHLTIRSDSETDSLVLRTDSSRSVFETLNAKIENDKEDELSELDAKFLKNCSKLMEKYPLVDLNSEVYSQVTFYNRDFEELTSKRSSDQDSVNKKYVNILKGERGKAIALRKAEIAQKKIEQADLSTPILPSSVDILPIVTIPSSVEVTTTPTDPSPVGVITTPTDPSPEEVIITPTDPSPADAITTPTDPTPVETITTPTDLSPVETITTPTDPTPTDAITTPTDPSAVGVITTPTDPTPTEAIATPTDPSSGSIPTIPTPEPSMDVVITPSIPVTYITVKYDAKYGNFLSICGNGPKMGWETGKAILLRCIGKDTWIYETNDPFESFDFKILFNGKVWEKGSNHSVHKNKPFEFTPSF